MPLNGQVLICRLPVMNGPISASVSGPPELHAVVQEAPHSRDSGQLVVADRAHQSMHTTPPALPTESPSSSEEGPTTANEQLLYLSLSLSLSLRPT